jgi:RHS repeat-associated protein
VGLASVVPGQNVVTLQAIDAVGNTATASYQVTAAASSKTFTFDANGNLVGDGTRTFEWDARNQLVAVVSGSHRSEFSYDGDHRRVGMTEKENGSVQGSLLLVWCGSEICEERVAASGGVLRRSFEHGEVAAGQPYYFTRDHRESINEGVDASGTLVARYSYDTWGKRSLLSGVDVASTGYTGQRTHYALNLSLFRAYDPATARWLSMDPLGDVDGPNRYAYVGNNPINRVDPLGLQASAIMPDVKRQTAKGIEAAIVSCLNKPDRLVYYKSTPFNPLVRQEEWKKWKEDFTRGCKKNPSPGYMRYATCLESYSSAGGGAAGVCSCCDAPCPKRSQP